MNREKGAPFKVSKKEEEGKSEGALNAMSDTLSDMINMVKRVNAEGDNVDPVKKPEKEKAPAAKKPHESAVESLGAYNNQLTKQLAQYIAQTHNFNESQIRVPGDGLKLATEIVSKNVRTGKNALLVALGTIGGMGAVKGLEALGASGVATLAPALAAPILASMIRVASSEVSASRGYSLSKALTRFDKAVTDNVEIHKDVTNIIKNAPESTEKRLPQKFINAAKFAARGRLGFATSALTRGITQDHVPIEKLVNKYKPLPIAALARTIGATAGGLAAGAAAFGIGDAVLRPMQYFNFNPLNGPVETPNVEEYVNRGIPGGIEQFKSLLQKIFLNN